MFCFLFLRFKLFDLGYESGLKLITALGDKLQTFTQAASIMGLTVVGALIPSVIHMTVGLEFAFGEVALNDSDGRTRFDHASSAPRTAYLYWCTSCSLREK